MEQSTATEDQVKKSKYLNFRFTLLFFQYAQKLKQPQTADSLVSASFYYSDRRTTGQPTSLSTDSLAVGVLGLMDMLAKVGPTIKEEQAKEFIYEYDSTLRGGLVLQDFLGRLISLGWFGVELMNDYLVVLKKSQESALRFYKTQVQLDNSGRYDGDGDKKKEAGFIDE